MSAVGLVKAGGHIDPLFADLLALTLAGESEIVALSCVVAT